MPHDITYSGTGAYNGMGMQGRSALSWHLPQGIRTPSFLPDALVVVSDISSCMQWHPFAALHSNGDRLTVSDSLALEELLPCNLLLSSSIRPDSSRRFACSQ